jgi:2-haloacid dehalogenase/putative hydrolase of the HAD superfamily
MGKLNKNETQKYKAIFFDFGGTLMCAESDNVAHLHMMKDVIQKYNLSASPEDMVTKYNSYLFTREMTLLDTDPEEKSFTPLRESTKKAFKGLLAEYNIQPSKEAFQWFGKSFIENHKKYIKLFPETLPILSIMIFKTFNSKSSELEKYLTLSLLRKRFKSTSRKKKYFKLLLIRQGAWGKNQLLSVILIKKIL